MSVNGSGGSLNKVFEVAEIGVRSWFVSFYWKHGCYRNFGFCFDCY